MVIMMMVAVPAPRRADADRRRRRAAVARRRRSCVMYLLGYRLDNLSLMALTIAIGFVVDDAIVVIENIIRHIEEGMTPLRGRAARARGEIGFTVVSITRLADRGVHPAAVHGRHRGPALPRVRGHAVASRSWSRRWSR